MITAVSIALYGCSLFFAATVGVTAAQFKKNDEANKSQGRFAVFFTVTPFLLAAILQVFS
jgi:dolichol kinase